MGTIGLAMIARNAGKTIEAALSCVRPYCDESVVVFGGNSTDNTEALAKKYADRTYRFGWRDDFAAARNFSFSKIKSDWIFWIDADDTLDHPERLRELAAYCEDKDIGAAQLPYDYLHDDDGNVVTWHQQHRLLRRSLPWYWKDRVHERVLCDEPHRLYYTDAIRVIHHSKGEGHNERNLRLLNMMYGEEPEFARTWLAIGHAHFSAGRFAEALEWYERYYQNPESDIEQWNAAVFAGKSCWQLKRWQDCMNWGVACVSAFPQLKDGYLLCAQAEWWDNQDEANTLAWIDSAQNKDEAPPAVFVCPRDYDINVWDVQHRALAKLDAWDQALAITEKALQISPGNQTWEFYHRLYEEATRTEVSVNAVAAVADHLVRRGDVLKAQELLWRYIPHSAETDQRILEMRSRVATMLSHLESDEAYQDWYDRKDYTKHHLDDWDSPCMEWARFAFVEQRARDLKPKRVLDIGCGAGAFLIRLAKLHGVEGVGLDVAPSMTELATLKAREAGVGDKLTFRTGQMGSPILDGTAPFDLILIMELLEHMDGHRAQHLMGMAEEVLAEGGHIIATCPAEMYGSGKGLDVVKPREHIREFNMRELEELLSKRYDRQIINLYKTRDATEALVPGFGTWSVEWELGQCDTPTVVFYLGPAWEHWEPPQIEKRGLGGSETGAVKLAEEFARRGYRVAVYSEWEGIYNRVIYRNWSRYNPKGPFLGIPAWLLVASRQPQALAGVAQHRWLWMHDTWYGSEFTGELADLATCIVPLSDWHKGFILEKYPFLLGRRILVSGDGLDPRHRPKAQRRKRHRFIYSSSPDRGLHKILEWWPEIRKLWSDAELHVFYGWVTYDAMVKSGRMGRDGSLKETILHMMDQAGVVPHERIGQVQLHEEFAKSHFWLYPSLVPSDEDWHETYCITGLEAQANGCIPITRPVGALAERCVFQESFVDSTDIKDFLAALRWWDKLKPDVLRERRKMMRQSAWKQTWAKVCDEWLDQLRERESAALGADSVGVSKRLGE